MITQDDKPALWILLNLFPFSRKFYGIGPLHLLRPPQNLRKETKPLSFEFLEVSPTKTLINRKNHTYRSSEIPFPISLP